MPSINVNEEIHQWLCELANKKGYKEKKNVSINEILIDIKNNLKKS